MTKSELFTAAHKIAKQTVAKVGNYMIAFSLALKALYKDLMMAITPESMIEAGGNLWEKGSMKRIYLNDTALDKLFDLDLSALKKIKPAKKTTYYCCYSEQFYSANGMIVRNAIRAADETAVKI